MTCSKLMTKSVACCSREDRADVAAQIMRDCNVGAIVVVELDKRPVGILTDRDLAVGICANAEDSYYKRVKEVMRSPVVCCRDSDDIAVAVNTMAERNIRRVPIVDGDGRLTGIISVDDLARSLDSEQMRPLLTMLSVGIPSLKSQPADIG
jgi:CBS domain-containing protein